MISQTKNHENGDSHNSKNLNGIAAAIKSTKSHHFYRYCCDGRLQIIPSKENGLFGKAPMYLDDPLLLYGIDQLVEIPFHLSTNKEQDLYNILTHLIDEIFTSYMRDDLRSEFGISPKTDIKIVPKQPMSKAWSSYLGDSNQGVDNKSLKTQTIYHLKNGIALSKDGANLLKTALHELSGCLRAKYQMWEDLVILEKLRDESENRESYRVFDPLNHRFFVKTSYRASQGNETSFNYRILKEIKALVHAQKSESPNMLRFCYIDFEPNQYYSVLFEYGLGSLQDLQDYYKENNLEWREADLQRILAQIYDLVKTLKKSNVHHRDIKPENIVVMDDWSLKLFSYELAEVSRGNDISLVRPAGTPKYWAPEIEIAHQKNQPLECDLYKADIYSTAVTVLNMACSSIKNSQQPTDAQVQKAYPQLHKELMTMIRQRKAATSSEARKVKKKKEKDDACRKGYRKYILHKIYEIIPHSSKEEGMSQLIELELMEECQEWILEQIENPQREEDKPIFLCWLSKIFFKRGQYKLAHEKLKLSLELSKSSIMNVMLYDYMGLLNIYLGDYEESIRCFCRAYECQFKSKVQARPRLANVNRHLGILYHQQKDYVKAIENFEKSMQSGLDLTGKDFTLFIKILNNFAFLYKDQGKYEEALKRMNNSLELQLKKLGSNHPRIAIAKNTLGHTFKARGKILKSLELFNQASEIYQKTIGENNPINAIIYQNLGHAYYLIGNYQDSFISYNNALNIFTKVIGHEHPNTGFCYESLGTLQLDKSQISEAIENFDKAHDILMKSYSPKDPIYFHSLVVNRSLAYISTKNIEKAYSILQEAIDNHKAQLDKDHPHDLCLAQLYNCLGFLEVEREDRLAAENAGIESLWNFLNCRHPLDPAVADIYNNLGRTYVAMEQYQHSINCLNLALIVQQQNFDTDVESVALSYERLGFVFTKQEKYEEALYYIDKAIEIRKEVFGSQSLKIGESYEDKAIIFWQMRSFDDALALYLKSYGIRKKIYGEKSHKLYQTIKSISDIYMTKYDFKSVLKYVKMVIDMEIAIHGADSLVLSETYLGLAIAEQNTGNVARAIEIYKKSKKIKKQYLENHPYDIAEAVKISNIHYFIGKAISVSTNNNEDMLKQYSRALQAFPKIDNLTSTQRFDLAKIYDEMGQVLFKMEKDEEALQSFQEALKLYKMDQSKCRSTLSNLYYRISESQVALGQEEEAIQNYKLSAETRIQVSGEDRLDVSMCYENIARLLFDQGNIDESRQWFMKALNVHTRIHGENHPTVQQYKQFVAQ